MAAGLLREREGAYGAGAPGTAAAGLLREREGAYGAGSASTTASSLLRERHGLQGGGLVDITGAGIVGEHEGFVGRGLVDVSVAGLLRERFAAWAAGVTRVLGDGGLGARGTTTGSGDVSTAAAARVTLRDGARASTIVITSATGFLKPRIQAAYGDVSVTQDVAGLLRPRVGAHGSGFVADPHTYGVLATMQRLGDGAFVSIYGDGHSNQLQRAYGDGLVPVYGSGLIGVVGSLRAPRTVTLIACRSSIKAAMARETSTIVAMHFPLKVKG